mmetsp:Transcript_26644/g.47939  ORF Transcript_26644/g.47939 Transcript_26644/m.47939 type:complete len:200 (+) Transcript_26644:744-1343(+)
MALRRRPRVSLLGLCLLMHFHPRRKLSFPESFLSCSSYPLIPCCFVFVHQLVVERDRHLPWDWIGLELVLRRRRGLRLVLSLISQVEVERLLEAPCSFFRSALDLEPPSLLSRFDSFIARDHDFSRNSSSLVLEVDVSLELKLLFLDHFLYLLRTYGLLLSEFSLVEFEGLRDCDVVLVPSRSQASPGLEILIGHSFRP